jgi:hypothetical protein
MPLRPFCPAASGSYGPSGKDAFALAPDLGIDLFERRHLGRGEAVRPVGAGFALGKIAPVEKLAAPHLPMMPSFSPSLASQPS